MMTSKRIFTHLGDELEIGSCSHPITIDKHDGYGKQTFGCGKCGYCRAKLRNVWNFRLNEEYTYNSQYAVFCTLTYDDASLSSYFDKKACQRFLKRLRKQISDYCEGLALFKYYFTSEFGSRTLRPHHHMIGFLYDGVWVEDEDGHCSCQRSPHFADLPSLLPVFLSRQWRFGFTLCEDINAPRINYITHYHSRPKKPAGVPDYAKDPFVLSSQCLGRFDLNDVVVRDGVPMVYNLFDGLWITLPPYYRKKFGFKIDQNLSLAPSSSYLSDNDMLYLKQRDKKFDINYNTESF